jgi:hypothetical protein
VWESKISGWQADWRPGAQQIAQHAEALTGLIGARLTGAWSIWIDASEDWFADMPVVLQFDNGQQLEVCWQKFDDLSLSWNTIDLSQKPEAWVEGLLWRPWAHRAFELNRGETVTAVGSTQFVWETSDVDHPNKPRLSRLVTGGVWIGTTGPGLHIFNALDENGLAPDLQGDQLSLIASEP